MFAILLPLALIISSRADDLDEKRKVATELVQVIGSDTPLDVEVRKDFLDQVEPTIAELKLSESDSNLFRRAAIQAIDEVGTHTVLDIAAEGYAQKLTLTELNQVLAFYKSPSGQAFLKQQPAIREAMATRRKQIFDDVARKVKENFEQLKKAEK